MQVYIDDDSTNIELSREDITLKEFIEDVETFLFGEGLVPTAINLNGQQLTQEELSQKEPEIVNDSQVIRFGTTPVVTFVRMQIEGTLEATEPFLGRLDTFVDELSSPEKTLQVSEFTNELSHFFEFWQNMNNMLTTQFQTVKVDGNTLSEMLEMIAKALTEGVAAMESKDIVLASDLLRYELRPAIENFCKGTPDLIAMLVKWEAELCDQKKQKTATPQG